MIQVQRIGSKVLIASGVHAGNHELGTAAREAKWSDGHGYVKARLVCVDESTINNVRSRTYVIVPATVPNRPYSLQRAANDILRGM